MFDTELDRTASLARSFSALGEAESATLTGLAPLVVPRLDGVTDRFYERLQSIPEAAVFVEGRLDSLRRTHRAWLEKLFSGSYDAGYAAEMYRVGEAHVEVRLPLEFMAGATTLIMDALIEVLEDVCRDRDHLAESSRAVNAVLGYSLMIMQESYHATSLANQLTRFLRVTGMSRDLFNNLASSAGN